MARPPPAGGDARHDQAVSARLPLRHGMLGAAVQDEIAHRRVDQPHLEHLGHAGAALAEASMQHHREDHGGGGSDAVFGVLLQLAGGVRHARQVRHHITLGQAGAKQQDARQRPVVHEQFFSALDLARVSPGRKHLRRLQVVGQCLGHLGGHIAFDGLVTFPHLDRAFGGLPMGQTQRCLATG